MKIITTIIFSLFSICASAQMSYRLTINYMAYTDFFNKEQDKIFSYDFGRYGPRLELAVFKNKMGISLYSAFGYSNYHDISYSDLRPNQIYLMSNSQLGLNFHYAIFNQRRFNAHVFLGANYGYLSSGRLITWHTWSENPPIYHAITSTKVGESWGLQTGLNFTSHIWKGIFASTNLRFTHYPVTNFSPFRNNFMWEVGLGYNLETKKKKKQ